MCIFQYTYFHVLTGNKNLKICCLISCKHPLLKVKAKMYRTAQIMYFCRLMYTSKRRNSAWVHTKQLIGFLL